MKQKKVLSIAEQIELRSKVVKKSDIYDKWAIIWTGIVVIVLLIRYGIIAFLNNISTVTNLSRYLAIAAAIAIGLGVLLIVSLVCSFIIELKTKRLELEEKLKTLDFEKNRYYFIIPKGNVSTDVIDSTIEGLRNLFSTDVKIEILPRLFYMGSYKLLMIDSVLGILLLDEVTRDQ